MAWLVTKYFATAAVVVLVSELARRTGRLGAFVGALPLVSLLALVWLHMENRAAAENRRSRLVHVLVRGAHAADVSRLSRAVAAHRLLARAGYVRRRHDRELRAVRAARARRFGIELL